MRVQAPEGEGGGNRVHLAEIAVRGDDVGLHTGVGAQPVADQLVHAAVDGVERRLGQPPDLRPGVIRA